MTPASEPLAWVDGTLVPRQDARVSIDDFGARYGASCFETMLARHGRVFRLDEHLTRLEGGLRLLRAEPPPRAALTEAIDATLAANELRDASVRLAVSAGSGGAPDLRAASHPLVTVTVDALAAPFGEERPPLRLAIASVRLDERRPWRGAKVGQYLPYLLARAEATAAPSAAPSAATDPLTLSLSTDPLTLSPSTDPLTLSLSKGDDALLLNYAGHIAEAATANVFLVVAGALVTPSLESGPIPGVTRAAVIEVARGLDVTVAEREVAPADLEQATAVFLTSSVAGIVEVTSITGAPPAAPSTLEWRRGEGDPLVARIRQAYLALIERECGA